MAGSISLVGFGIDSAIEVTSGAALLWRMMTDADERHRERRERVTLRVVGVSFLALSAYVLFTACRTLVLQTLPQPSPMGIAIAVLSLIVMPLLARQKRAVAKALGSRALHADAKQTDLCMYLSAILLGGLAFNAAFGLWWADPIAGLIMTPIIVKEGVDALRGDPCCD
jgi:divalent metal cation (Fe/Co/Zn/Cd) transporter